MLYNPEALRLAGGGAGASSILDTLGSSSCKCHLKPVVGRPGLALPACTHRCKCLCSQCRFRPPGQPSLGAWTIHQACITWGGGNRVQSSPSRPPVSLLPPPSAAYTSLACDLQLMLSVYSAYSAGAASKLECASGSQGRLVRGRLWGPSPGY